MKFKLFYSVVVTVALLALASCGGDKTAAVPSSPDGTVKSIASAIANQQPQAIWRAMPKSYQQDVNQIIRLTAEMVSQENYDKTASLFRRVLKVLKDKKAIFIGAMKKMPVPAKDVNAGYDAAVEVFGLLVNSQLGSHSTLKNLDVDKFLSTTGSSIMKAMGKVNPDISAAMTEADNVTVKLVSSSGDKAVVELTRAKDKSKKKMTLVKVEGRWIPEKMSRKWKAETGKMIAALNKKKADAAQMNMMMKVALPELEKVVVDLEKINNEADLMALQMKMMSGSLMQMMMMNRKKPVSRPSPSPAPAPTPGAKPGTNTGTTTPPK